MGATTAETSGLVVTCAACGQRNRVPYGGLGQATVCGACKADIAPLAAPIEVKAADEFDALVASSPVPVLVDFWAPWCGPCRMVAPELEKVAAARAGRLVVAKVNTEEAPDLAQRYGVYSIPTMGVFSGGRPVLGAAGARPASAIEEMIDEAMRKAAE